MASYTVNTRKNGKHTVEYECGHCKAPLESPLQEAGQSIPCPTCGASVQTPGTEELRKHRSAHEQQRMQDAKRTDAESASKEITDARRRAEEKAPIAREQATADRAPQIPADDIIVLRSRLHPKAVFLGPTIGCLISFFVAGVMFMVPNLPVAFPICALLIFPTVTFPLAFMGYRFTDFTVTNRRIAIRRGWLSTHTFEMLLQQVESVYVEQSILGRSFGFGTIVIHGTGGSREHFKGIRSPQEFRRVATDAIERCVR